MGLGSGVANVALSLVRLVFWGHVSRVFCVAARCAVVVVVEVVCAVLGWCGELGLRSGKCLWLIAHCGWVVLWRDQGGRDAGLMYGLQYHSCAVLSSGAVSCWGLNSLGQVIAAACSRGGWVWLGRHCAADDVISAGW